MSLKIFSNKEAHVMDEEAWEDYHKSFRDIEKQLELRNIAAATDIIKKNLPEGGKVLDAGCGNGGFLLSFRGFGLNSFFGVDFSSSALNILKSYDNSQMLAKSNVSKLPFRDSSFDAVVSLGVVEHFEEGPSKVLKECYRVLKPEGLLICSVPYANCIRHLMYPVYLAAYGFIFGKVKNFIEYRYTRREMVGFCQDTGFIIKDTFYVDLKPNNFSYFWFVDFGPCFKKKNAALPFELNTAGAMLKRILKPFPFLQAGGIMIICRKR